MHSPVWLPNESAWIALGVSLVFVMAALVMHRVALNDSKIPQRRAVNDCNPLQGNPAP